VSGVGHPAIVRHAATSRDTCFPLSILRSAASSVEHRHFSSPAPVVGHPVQPLPDVGSADARSAQIGGPNGKTQVFQVSTYSGEPFTSILARNLLSKDDWRLTLGDEPFESGPQVALVSNPLAFACRGERLAWA
jgi:hypothetical protein